MKAQAYYDYLLSKVPEWEADVLRDWMPTDDAWMGRVIYGKDDAEITLETVRSISEGLAYKQNPVFKSASVKSTKGWKLFDTLPE